LTSAYENKAKKLTALHQDLTGSSPEDGKSMVQYMKGYELFIQLEKLIGEENFQHFLTKYVKKFRQKSITSYDFVNLFEKFTKKLPGGKKLLPHLNFTEWIFTGGSAVYEKDFSTASSRKAIDLAQDYLKGHVGSPEGFRDLDSTIP
jgi:aminopeptidase N